jgi:hypothetical protein
MSLKFKQRIFINNEKSEFHKKATRKTKIIIIYKTINRSILCCDGYTWMMSKNVQVALEDFEGKTHRRKYGPIPVNSQCRNRCSCAVYELHKDIYVDNTY